MYLFVKNLGRIHDGLKTVVKNGEKIKVPMKKHFVTLTCEGIKFSKRKIIGDQ